MVKLLPEANFAIIVAKVLDISYPEARRYVQAVLPKLDPNPSSRIVIGECRRMWLQEREPKQNSIEKFEEDPR